MERKKMFDDPFVLAAITLLVAAFGSAGLILLLEKLTEKPKKK
jgi:hypothetical protein